MPGGRPTKYDPKITPRIAEGLYRMKHTDAEVAACLKINIDTLHEWLKVHPEFSESRKKAREGRLVEVENALFKRALGYQFEEKHVETLRDTKGREIPDRKKYKILTKSVAPDVAACIFILCNHMKDKYQSVQRIEHDVAGESPLTLSDILKGLHKQAKDRGTRLSNRKALSKQNKSDNGSNGSKDKNNNGNKS